MEQTGHGQQGSAPLSKPPQEGRHKNPRAQKTYNRATKAERPSEEDIQHAMTHAQKEIEHAEQEALEVRRKPRRDRQDETRQYELATEIKKNQVYLHQLQSIASGKDPKSYLKGLRQTDPERLEVNSRKKANDAFRIAETDDHPARRVVAYHRGQYWAGQAKELREGRPIDIHRQTYAQQPTLAGKTGIRNQQVQAANQ